MDDEPILLQVRDGDLVGVGSWVYVWLRPGAGAGRAVIYVGSTGVPPVVRTWLHLHDADPEIGRVRARYPDVAHDAVDVLAFPVPPELDRRAVRAALIDRLDARGLLSERYAGDQLGLLTSRDGGSPLVDRTAARMADQVVTHAGL